MNHFRTHLAENKSLNIIMHRKKRGNTNSRLNTMSGYSRERTRSRPRERNLNDKDFEFNLGQFSDPELRIRSPAERLHGQSQNYKNSLETHI